MKPNIGVDIDSTVFNTEDSILNYIGLFYNEVFHKGQIKNGLEDLNVDDFVIRDSIDIAVSDPNLHFYQDAKKILKWLSEFYNIYFITYRSINFFKQTTELLGRIGIDYNLIQTRRELGKHNLIGQKDIKVLIEDDFATINDVSERTDCTCLIYTQPWNVEIQQDYNKVRVYNWKEIKDYFIISMDI